MTKMGAPGVRIELKDSSQYTVIENPNAIAAIVGFAPQGELNKVTRLTNTAVQDTTFGIGFNNWKYNQGLYAARAVLNAGGYVQYVRPYGEEIDKSDPRKRDLKTDTFVVSFDRGAANPKSENDTSLKIEYFAATRYKSDGAANYGVTRKINNIAETVSSGSNVDFTVYADEGFADSPKARSKTDTVLFAIMDADPSSARRAVESYDVVSYDSLNDGDPSTFRVIFGTNPDFTIGDIVYGPADTRTNTFCTFTVTGMDGKQVDITAYGKETENACIMGYKPSDVLMFSPNDAIGDTDADYLTVKTAVTGRGAKLFSALRIDSDGIEKLSKQLFNGTLFNVRDQSNAQVSVRIANGNFYVTDENPFKTLTSADEPIDMGIIPGLVTGDTVTMEWGYDTSVHNGTFMVAVDEDSGEVTAYLNDSAWLPKDILDPSKFGDNVTIRNATTGWTEDIDYVTLAVPEKGDYESDADYANRFRNALILAFKNTRLGFSTNVVTNDIMMEAGDFKAGVTKVFKMTPGSVFDYNVGDHVAIVRGSFETVTESKDEPEAFSAKNSDILMLTKVAALNGYTNEVTLVDAVTGEFVETVTVNGDAGKEFNPNYKRLQLLNLEQTNKSVYTTMPTNVVEVYEDIVVTVDGTSRTMRFTGEPGLVGKRVTYVVDGETIETVVASSNEDELEEGETDVIYTLRGTGPADVSEFDARLFTGEEKAKVVIDLYLIGNFDVTVNSTVQKVTSPVELDGVIVDDADGDAVFTYEMSGKDTAVVMQTEKVLRNSEIGANFVGLGLANIKYEDINFTGVTEKVYDLTEAGESVARLYMSCTYRFNGSVHTFDGTVVEYVYNDTQLFIGDAAESEFSGTGIKFILNESGILDAFLDDESWDLSETVLEGIPSASMTAVAFNREDPAVQWNAIWEYLPTNNNSTSTLATAYSLFLDKDKADQTFFVAAGNDVNNFGWAGRETMNTTVINAILNICELRKDCFALFDAPAEQNIEAALKKDVIRFPSTLGRWGAIYDARPLFYDSMITRRNVECAPSIAMANLITANRSGNIFWYVPAGKDTGIVPSAWCTRVKYERKFNYPEDPDSDIARLCDAHVNPFRTNDEGIFCWGDFTMQMEDSAFNQIHVAMLIAGIHKMFYKYLDGKVFRLNTAALRSQISSDLQAKLNMIRDSNPSGFYDAVAICDDTNNTPEVIDQNKLYVDLKLKPTKSTRYIYLRTEVLATSSGNSVTFTEVGR